MASLIPIRIYIQLKAGGESLREIKLLVLLWSVGVSTDTVSVLEMKASLEEEGVFSGKP